jgi:hypothetical protein
MRPIRAACKRPPCPGPPAPRKRMKVAFPDPPADKGPARGHRPWLVDLPGELVQVTFLYLTYQDLAGVVTTCKALNRCAAEYLKKLSRFDFPETVRIARLLVLLTSSWSPTQTAAFVPVLLRRWKTDFLQQRGTPFSAILEGIKFGDASHVLAALHWEPPRALRECRTREQRLARARTHCDQLRSLVNSTAALQFAMLQEDLEAVLNYVRGLPPEPPSEAVPIIPQGPQLLLLLCDYFTRMMYPWPLLVPPDCGPVTLDHCRVRLLKVCRKVLVRMRPTAPPIIAAVHVFRQRLTDCVKWYGKKPDAFDPEVARGLVKLIRKSRLYFVDQCSNPHCGRAEASPQEHKRCSACAWVKYCSKECQRSDWTKHRVICQVLHHAVYPTPALP